MKMKVCAWSFAAIVFV